MDGRRLRLAVVVSHPIQYHICLWQALAAAPDLDVEVLYCSDEGTRRPLWDAEFGRPVRWDRPMLEGYSHRVFTNLSPSRRGFLRFVDPGLLLSVLRDRRDAVFVHYRNDLTHVLALLAARISGKRVVLRSISHNLEPRRRPRAWLRRAFYSMIFALAHRILYIGRHNFAFFRTFGVGEDKLVFAPHVVDNDFFRHEAERLRHSRSELMAAFGLRDRQRVILFCGKLIHKKRPLLLLRAFQRAALGPDWALLFVGDGALRGRLEATAATCARAPVQFSGFLNQREIGRAYAVAEALVLPSAEHETWGLVVNEALNFGCAAIVSDRVGCAPELVEGRTGLVVPHEDEAALAAALRRMAREPGLLAKWQAQAPQVVAPYSAESFVDGLRLAVQPP